MINTVTLTGRLGKDIELRKTTSGLSVTNFSIANERSRGGQQDKVTDWINCVVWKQGADYLSNYAHKGDMIGITGRLQNSSYTDRTTGKTITVTEVLCDHVEIESKKQANADPYAPPEIHHVEPAQEQNESSIDYSNLPF